MDTDVIHPGDLQPISKCPHLALLGAVEVVQRFPDARIDTCLDLDRNTPAVDGNNQIDLAAIDPHVLSDNRGAPVSEETSGE